MEEKINVAEILKNKPQGTKLYDLLYNIDVELDTISTTDTETVVWCINETDNNTTCHRGYSEFGTVRGYPDGLQILLPSKEMCDWEKFSWKRGDVLVNKDESVHIIFEKFEDDAYKNFHGQYYLWEEGGSMVSFEEDENYMQTSDFNKANKEDAQEYIHKIEKILGGKFNMETLEIEKPQPEFKDGDIVVEEEDNYYDRVIFIAAIKDDIVSKALINVRYEDYEVHYNEYRFGRNRSLRLATEEEKQQLFEALAKEGKRWDAKKKAIVDLKPKAELKPFDKVLVRDNDTEPWMPAFFEREYKHKFFLLSGFCFNQCIPYIGNEQLLGTIKDVED